MASIVAPEPFAVNKGAQESDEECLEQVQDTSGGKTTNKKTKKKQKKGKTKGNISNKKRRVLLLVKSQKKRETTKNIRQKSCVSLTDVLVSLVDQTQDHQNMLQVISWAFSAHTTCKRNKMDLIGPLSTRCGRLATNELSC
jgi:hypothetical protein